MILSNIYICPLPCQKKPLFIISSWWPGHPVIICVHIVCLDCSILTLVAFVGLHDDEVMTRVSSLTAQFILLGTFIGGEGGVLDVLRAKVQNLPVLILSSSSSFSAIFSGVRGGGARIRTNASSFYVILTTNSKSNLPINLLGMCLILFLCSYIDCSWSIFILGDDCCPGSFRWYQLKLCQTGRWR